MPQCRDCKYYKPIDSEKGDCFGHTIAPDSDAELCPSNSFQPKEERVSGRT